MLAFISGPLSVFVSVSVPVPVSVSVPDPFSPSSHSERARGPTPRTGGRCNSCCNSRALRKPKRRRGRHTSRRAPRRLPCFVGFCANISAARMEAAALFSFFLLCACGEARRRVTGDTVRRVTWQHQVHLRQTSAGVGRIFVSAGPFGHVRESGVLTCVDDSSCANVCVCVCVVRERDGEREKAGARSRVSSHA